MSRAAQCDGAQTAAASRARRSRRRQPLLAVSGIALAALLTPVLHAPKLRLVWNASASLPLGLYRIEPGAEVRTGDTALVRPWPALESFMAERRYVERNVPLIKPVAAVAGATVCRNGLRVTIGSRRVAAALPRDRFGRPLPRWSGCHRLREDELFLIAAETAASFDSRYFGPVTRAQVIGRALPVWTVAMSASLRIALAAAALGVGWLSPAPAGAIDPGANACARRAPEAAQRSGLPVDIILRVMHAESRGRPRSVSYKGAMGCMQIMPPTWAYLTRRYGLGSDPFDPRMNMIGGALYLAELAGQFGFPGAYSAYNAGPGRYLRYVRDGVPLPPETIAYATQIAGGGAVPPRSGIAGPTRAARRWQEAGLFMISVGARAPALHASDAETGDDGDRSDRPPANMMFPLLRPAVATVRVPTNASPDRN